MSSSIVVFEVPRAENETVFLLRVVQAALKAYRNTDHRSVQLETPSNPAPHQSLDTISASEPS
jgi:hypothetical protein